MTSEQPGPIEGAREMNEQKPVDLEAIRARADQARRICIVSIGLADNKAVKICDDVDALCDEVEALRELLKELDVVVKNVEEWEADESRGAGEAFDLLMQFMQIMRPDEEPTKGTEKA